MIRYLVDTSTLSALAPDRGRVDEKLLQFIESHGSELYISSMTVAEIAKGIAKLRRMGAQNRANQLETWLEAIEARYAERILPFDTRAARIAGDMDDRAAAAGRHPGLGDIIIAATAVSTGMTVLAANKRHFESLGVACRDPAAAT